MSRTALKTETLAVARAKRAEADEKVPPTVMGMDPGAHTGVALYRGGTLVALETITPREIAAKLADVMPARLVFEDSRLESFVWTSASSKAAALKMARNVGQIDAWCTLITEICADLGIPCHGISPKAKGAKVAADAFGRITGWEGRTNGHERDAAMVAWRYRHARA